MARRSPPAYSTLPLGHPGLCGGVAGDPGPGEGGVRCQEASQYHELSQQMMTFTALQAPPWQLSWKQSPPHMWAEEESAKGIMGETASGTRQDDSHQQEGQQRFISVSNSQTKGGIFHSWPGLGHPTPHPPM